MSNALHHVQFSKKWIMMADCALTYHELLWQLIFGSIAFRTVCLCAYAYVYSIYVCLCAYAYVHSIYQARLWFADTSSELMLPALQSAMLAHKAEKVALSKMSCRRRKFSLLIPNYAWFASPNNLQWPIPKNVCWRKLIIISAKVAMPLSPK